MTWDGIRNDVGWDDGGRDDERGGMTEGGRTLGDDERGGMTNVGG